MRISGFTYVHNALAGGYPIIEAMEAVLPFVDELVVVDAESDDGTVNLLLRYSAIHKKVLVADGRWGDQAGETLARLHAMHAGLCRGNVILHFEADEVFDPQLASYACYLARQGNVDLRFWRLQVEQNFQKCRWYPHLVHRLFPRGSVKKVGETTDRNAGHIVEPEHGFVWDMTNCFRDHWMSRLRQQSELRGSEPLNELAVPEHANLEPKMDGWFFDAPHWTWASTPLAIPAILKPLVGKVRYEPTV